LYYDLSLNCDSQYGFLVETLVGVQVASCNLRGQKTAKNLMPDIRSGEGERKEGRKDWDSKQSWREKELKKSL
jgi:hypothetical protein